jgi:hypothetical protein
MGKKNKIKKKTKVIKLTYYVIKCDIKNVDNFYIKHFFIIFQIKKLQRLFDTFVPLGILTLLNLCNANL